MTRDTSKRADGGEAEPAEAPPVPRRARKRSPPRAPREAVVVLGMHRSGTSALAGALGLAGLALPAHLMEATDANPRGYFESRRLYELHEELLAEIGTAWSDVSPTPAGFHGSPEAGLWVERLAEAVEAEFGAAPRFVLKDPRMCRLVPLWNRVFDRLGAEPRWILAVRNPLEVAASLRREHQLEERLGLLLWLDHVLRAERDTRGQPRVVVAYERFLADWRQQLGRIERTLGIGFPRLSRGREAEIDAFLSGTLRRQRASPSELAGRDDVAGWIKTVYAWSLDVEAESSAAARPLDAVAEAVWEAERAFGPVLASVEHARRVWSTEAGALRSALDDARGDVHRREEDVAKTQRELAAARDALARAGEQLGDRDAQIERLLAWVKTLVAWSAQASRRAAPDEAALEEAFRALEAAQPAQRTAAATAALRFAALSADVEWLRRELTQREAAHAERAREFRETVAAEQQRCAQLRAALQARETELETARAAAIDGEARALELDRRAAALGAELETARAAAIDGEARALELDRRAAALRAELAVAGAELERTLHEASGREATLAADTARARAEAAEQQRLVERARAELADRCLQVERLRAELVAVERSLAWRLLRPVRAVEKLVRR